MGNKSQSRHAGMATRSERKKAEKAKSSQEKTHMLHNKPQKKQSVCQMETRRKKKTGTTQNDKAESEVASIKSSARAVLKRKKKRGISENESNRNEYDKALGRFKGQISRFRQEQALIMAYDAEGWKGASKEKIKPHAEITRARDSIAKCLQMIRECIRICDEAGGDKSIPSECFDEDGELDADKIFCGKCLKSDSTDDNDIIMCDGMCDRAYHMKCVFPPVDISVLEDDADEGWLCPACDRKIDMIDEINDELGTDYDYEDSWETILIPGSLPEHEIYDFKTSAECENASKSWLDVLDLPSEDESDEDFCELHSETSSDTVGAKGDEEYESVSSEFGGGSDSFVSEDFDGTIKDVNTFEVKMTEDNSGRLKENIHELLENEEVVILNRKRKRSKVDYNALNKELFGDAASPEMNINGHASTSDDDDDAIWSPTKKRK